MSTDFFQKLKQVNKRHNLIVYGYLRTCQGKIFGELSKLNAYYNFPEIINKICLVYYHIIDDIVGIYFLSFMQILQHILIMLGNPLL